MPWGLAAAAVGGVASAATSSALGGGGGGGGSGSSYVPYNQMGQDTNFNNMYNTYANTLGTYYGNINPFTNSLLLQSQGPQGADQYQQGAGLAQQAYYGAGAGAASAGQQDYNLAGQLALASQNWGANGTQLAQLQQQSADAANAQSYLRGTQNSPYGAATAANAIDQTNLNYAQQQAATQAQLAQAAQGAYAAGTTQLGTGAGYYGTGAALPYQAGQQILGGEFQGLQNYYGTQQPYLQGLNQLQGNSLQYLGYGNAANLTAQQAGINTQNLYSGLAQGIGQAGAAVYGGLNGSSGGGGGGYNFTGGGGTVYSNPGSYDYYGSGNYYAGGLGY